MALFDKPALSCTAHSWPRGWAVVIRAIPGRIIVAALLALVEACGSRPSASLAVLVDDAGDSAAVVQPARRVVSLIPATTELLFAIGAGGQVVGRTNWCDYPAAAAAVPNLGDGISPNLEAIVAASPDLVILYNSSQNARVAGRLRELGVPVIRLTTDRLGDVGRVAAILGRLTGHAREADSLAAALDTALAAATVPRAAEPPDVLLLVWEQPPMTIGRGSFLSELVERAGGRNLFADVASSAGAVSIEAIAVRDPDLILTTADGPSAFLDRPEWQAVPAIRGRRFIKVTGSEFSRPGPRTPTAIRELRRMLQARTR
ncbi:MAG TPA: helical backbone metal receptor [Gemmatimonadales bacterium]|nr:helical backbone metal receptor [Gemmatimonadales bacterium]